MYFSTRQMERVGTQLEESNPLREKDLQKIARWAALLEAPQENLDRLAVTLLL